MLKEDCVEMFQRVPRKEEPLAFGEQVGQRQVDGPHRAVKIDRAKQLGSNADERE